MESSKNRHIQKPKLWIATELFYPDQTSTSYILSKIANKLSDKYQVNVVTDSSLYQNIKAMDQSYFSINEEVVIHKIKTKKRDKNKLLQRTLKLLVLSIKMFAFMWRNTNKNDKVFIVTNPAPLIPLVSLLKKIKKIHLTVLVHDVFPENTIPLGFFKSNKSITYKLIAFVFSKAYTTVDTLIVLGKDMKEVIRKKVGNNFDTENIHIVENWGDTKTIFPNQALSDIIAERHKNGIITIQYAGNIGRLQGLENFIDAFHASCNKKVHLDLWGDGALKSELMKKTSSYGLNDRVTFHGSYSRDEQNTILNSADIALVTLAPGMYGLGVPSKTYNIMSAGKPILFLGDISSEIGSLVSQEDIGFCLPYDSNSLVSFIDNLDVKKLPVLKEMGKRARQKVENNYSEEIILNKFLEVI